MTFLESILSERRRKTFPTFNENKFRVDVEPELSFQFSAHGFLEIFLARKSSVLLGRERNYFRFHILALNAAITLLCEILLDGISQNNF